MSLDPVTTNPAHYRVVFENERVRVLEYTDVPGDRTTPHRHPDSVMHTLSRFRRRLISGDQHRDVAPGPVHQPRSPAAVRARAPIASQLPASVSASVAIQLPPTQSTFGSAR